MNKFDKIESYFNNTSQHSTDARKALEELRKEYAALVSVAESAEKLLKRWATIPTTGYAGEDLDGESNLKAGARMGNSLANLAAVRTSQSAINSEDQLRAAYETALREYEQAHRVWMDTPVPQAYNANQTLDAARSKLDSARAAFDKLRS